MEFRYHNGQDRLRTFILEPWAEEYEVPPGSDLRVKIRYGHPGTLESDDAHEYFTIWLWSGCQAEVEVDGRVVSSAATEIKSP